MTLSVTGCAKTLNSLVTVVNNSEDVDELIRYAVVVDGYSTIC